MQLMAALEAEVQFCASLLLIEHQPAPAVITPPLKSANRSLSGTSRWRRELKE
jgi:hypothetical protein